MADEVFLKKLCRPIVSFFPINKVIPQFFIKGFSSNKPLIFRIKVLLGSCNFVLFFHFTSCTNCKPSGKRACTRLNWTKRTNCIKGRGDTTKGKECSIKKLQIPALPPKSQMHGVTFHFKWALKTFTPIRKKFSPLQSKRLFLACTKQSLKPGVTYTFFFIISLPLELLPVLRPLKRWRDAYTWHGPAV